MNGHSALRKGRMSLPQAIYMITIVTEKRQTWFADFSLACTAARCFEDVRILKNNRMLAWVLMPDHAHCLLQLSDQDVLSQVIARLKSASARLINRLMKRSGSCWQRAFHDRALRKEDDLRALAHYIIDNPVRAGLVQSPRDYVFWNAVWL